MEPYETDCGPADRTRFDRDDGRDRPGRARCDCLAGKDKLVVRLFGEIDHHSARDLRETIDRQLLLCRPMVVTFDLSDVAFMDSAGLGLLLGRYTRVTDLGGVMQVMNPSPSIKKILTLASLDRYIRILESPKEVSHEKDKNEA